MIMALARPLGLALVLVPAVTAVVVSWATGHMGECLRSISACDGGVGSAVAGTLACTVWWIAGCPAVVRITLAPAAHAMAAVSALASSTARGAPPLVPTSLVSWLVGIVVVVAAVLVRSAWHRDSNAKYVDRCTSM